MPETAPKQKKKVDINNEYATIRINPKIYPLDIVYSAAYIMTDKAFILLDGDPEKEIIAEIRAKKEGQSLQNLIVEFNEELLNYATYKSKSKENQDFRKAIFRTVFMSRK